MSGPSMVRFGSGSEDFSPVWFEFVVTLLYIFEQLPPPGFRYLVVVGSNVGYRWVPLDPQGPKTLVALRISGPDQHGRRQQVPGGPEPGHPQGLIFWKSC